MSDRAKLFCVFLFFLGLSALYTAPLGRYLNSGFPYTHQPSAGHEVIPFTQGDSAQLYYHFWMAWDYATGGPGPFFRDPYEFAVGEERVFTTRRLPLSLLYVLLCPFGTVFAYNALILLCVALAGWCAFLLARFYTGKTVPSLVAGAIYGLSPFALGQILGGHTNGFLLFFLPLILLWMEKGFRSGRSGWFLLTASGFVSFALIEYHLLYYIFLFAPAFFLARAAAVRPGWKKFLRHAAALALAAAAGLAVMFAIKHFEISGSLREGGRPLSEVLLYSPAWRDLFERVNANNEKNIYLGFFPLAGAALAFLLRGWKSGLFWLFAAAAAVFAWLSLGISSAKLGWLYLFFYDHLPYFSMSRLPGRMWVMAALAIAVLCALGLSRVKKGAMLLALLFLAGVGVEYFPRAPAGISLLPEPSRAYAHVSEQRNGGKLLCLPIWPGDTAWSSVYLYHVTQSRVALINGYYPVVPKNYVEEVFYPLYSMNVGEVLPEQVELLRRLGVKHVLFHEEAFPEKVSHFPARFTLERLKASPHLNLVLQAGPHWLFELNERPQPKKDAGTAPPPPVLLKGEKLKKSPGFLADHRIQILPPGNYEAVFRLNGPPKGTARLQILAQDPFRRRGGDYFPPEPVAEKTGSAGETKIRFTLGKALLLTLRVQEAPETEVESVSIALLP